MDFEEVKNTVQAMKLPILMDVKLYSKLITCVHKWRVEKENSIKDIQGNIFLLMECEKCQVLSGLTWEEKHNCPVLIWLNPKNRIDNIEQRFEEYGE